MDILILENPLKAYGVACATGAAVFAAAMILRRQFADRLKRLALKTASSFDDFLVEQLDAITAVEFGAAALYFASRALTLNAAAAKLLHILFLAVVAWRAVAWLQAALAYAALKLTERAGLNDAHATAALRNLRFILQGAIWLGAVLFVLGNLGVDVTAAVAGLGISGIMVAMAAQSIFKDIFSSFVLYIDNPFKVGDFIVVDDMMGTVEHIGIMTSRVRSLSGELLIFPNSNLAASRIRNFKQLRTRRIAFGFGVVYDTPRAKLEAIPGIVSELFSGLESARFDRAHFKAFSTTALEFEVVYHVLSDDYTVYMDIQHRLNLGLVERFHADGIAFAYAKPAPLPR